MLGRLQMTVEDCIDKYLEISKAAFQPRRSNMNLFARARDGWNIRGRLDTAALQKEIIGLIDGRPGESGLDSLMLKEDLACRSFAVSIGKAAPDTAVLLRTYPSLRDTGLRPKIWEAARATSAASSFFDPIQIGKFGQWFTDGATGFNNPVNQVYEEALEIWADAKDNIQCIVSIGTGEPGVKPFGDDLKGLALTLLSVATQTEETSRRFAKSHSHITHIRLNVVHGLQGIGLQEYNEIATIKSVTDRYLDDTEGEGNRKISQFADLIKSGGPFFPDPVCSQPLLLHLTRFRNYFDCQQLPTGLTVSIPEHIFGTHDEHSIPNLATKRPQAAQQSNASWMSLHETYCCQSLSNIPCKSRRLVSEVAWITQYGGLILAKVDISEVWRLLSSRVSILNGERDSRVHTDWVVNDVTVVMIGDHAGEPLIRAVFRARDGHSLDHTFVLSSAFAQAMTSGRGIRPIGDLGPKYTNQMPGYELVPLENLVQIAYKLWDDDDSIDCNSEGVPIKVILEDMIRSPSFQIRIHGGALSRLAGIFRLLKTATGEYFRQLPADDIFEMEDVMRLIGDLEDIMEPGHLPLHISSWVGCFGNKNGRWLVLELLINGLSNILDCGILPDAFDSLLRSPTRKCYLA
ncbi:calcium-independent phospholipase A2-gamma [Fusarium pseudocircinatum]|uniref:Calcium-independent phospholipase A2-gamma n=1 Tax=Fusarium pseudocircinatum TaxID=56676 RepID=A0A8H5NT26_9HYPO|nr:calcium-independent phospholipase A2-gamma [Fusarium pseudocircinatum]